MSGGPYCVRLGCDECLDKQKQKGKLSIQTVRNPSKMVREKEILLHWISKLVARTKVGALLLFVVFTVVFICALLVGKEGEEVQEGDLVLNIGLTDRMTLSYPEPSPTFGEQSNNITFVRGIKPGHNIGFDMDEDDLLDMKQCNGVVVASAIFGNFDEINQPKHIGKYAKDTVCFYMFIDEQTEAYMKSSDSLRSSKKIGLWRIVVVRNLPYMDPRRNGMIPKLLLHRIFPNACYSMWIDGKLQLVVDPYQILERFLWRTNETFAISRHYARFDVYIEAEANKAAKKYSNTSIDFQIEFYKRKGLTQYTQEKLPITSDVPEGCVIIKEHLPISNLFTCLWFNEVDRFTPRDLLSFLLSGTRTGQKPTTLSACSSTVKGATLWFRNYTGHCCCCYIPSTAINERPAHFEGLGKRGLVLDTHK